jgi:PAS domain S-box-containing protein
MQEMKVLMTTQNRSTADSPTKLPSSDGQDSASIDSVQETYRHLIQGIDSAQTYSIILLDPYGYIRTWNEGAKRIEGYEPNEIIGEHLSRFYTDQGKQHQIPNRNLEYAKNHGSFEQEDWRVRKDGSVFWANIVITPIFDQKQGKLLGFTRIVRDLTERKEGEETLRQSEERFRSLVEGVKDYAIFMLDANGIVSTWNEGAKRCNGYEAQEIIGQHFSVFYPEEAVKRHFPDYELKMATKQGRFEDEGWRVRKDGSLFWSNVVITALFNTENKLIGFSKVTRDLTERKRIVDELENAKNSAEALNKELEAFSYSVSHDLRAPLRNIDGYTRLVLEDKAAQLDDEAKDYLERVSLNAQQMGQLIDGLLNLSRLSRTELSKAPVNLTEQAQEILKTLQEQEPERNIHPSIQENLIANADPVLMRCVLQNLLGNAWKFTRDKDETVIKFGSKEHDGKPVFFIRDNGAGFNMKYAAKLFGAFQRLHNVSEFPGTGIGLATVQRILHRHGGEIWAESAEGQGTTFYFRV